MMSVYAVFLNNPDEKAWQLLREKWPNRHFILTSNMAFVSPEEITLTARIMDTLEIGEDRNIHGIVFGVDDYSGFARPDLWEWFSKVEQVQK